MAVKLYRAKDAQKLHLLHPQLRLVVELFASRGGKFIIVTTTRSKAEQEKARSSGHSNAHFGQSPHNYNPALAVDIGPVPYPGLIIDYKKLRDGMFTAAHELGIHLTWGGDWKIRDYPHFELTNWKLLKGNLVK